MKWTGPLILWLSRHEQLPTEVRWLLEPLWGLIRKTGGHIDMRAMPGGYAKASGAVPFQFSWAELKQVLRFYCFAGAIAYWSSIDLYAIGGIFDGNAITVEQRASLTDQLIYQLQSARLIEYVNGLSDDPHATLWRMTQRGCTLAGCNYVEVRMPADSESSPL